VTSIARQHHVYTWHEGKWVHRERAVSPEEARKRADDLNVNDPDPLQPKPKPTAHWRGRGE